MTENQGVEPEIPKEELLSHREKVRRLSQQMRPEDAGLDRGIGDQQQRALEQTQADSRTHLMSLSPEDLEALSKKAGLPRTLTPGDVRYITDQRVKELLGLLKEVRKPTQSATPERSAIPFSALQEYVAKSAESKGKGYLKSEIFAIKDPAELRAFKEQHGL